MNAVILAGGKGTRLASRSNGLPKSLVPIQGKTLLDYQLELLARHKVEQVVLLCGYGAEAIREYCGDGSRWNLRITCIAEKAPLGTAGAVIASLDSLPDEFLVLYGDTVVNVDLRRFYDAHQASGAEATLFLQPNDHPDDSDIVDSDEHGRILAIHGYPHPQGAILPGRNNAALYVVKASLLRRLPVPETVLDFAKHLFPQLLKENVYLYGYRSSEFVKDGGTPERLDEIEDDLRSGFMAKGSLEVRKPAVFLHRDCVIEPAVAHLSQLGHLQPLPGSATAIHSLRAAGYRMVVLANLSSKEAELSTPGDMLHVHDYMEMQLGRQGAYLDGVYVMPEAEMAQIVKQAAVELNIELEGSWYLGNRAKDVSLAQSCGLRPVSLNLGAETSEAQHGNSSLIPAFENHLAAAQFIQQSGSTAAER